MPGRCLYRFNEIFPMGVSFRSTFRKGDVTECKLVDSWPNRKLKWQQFVSIVHSASNHLSFGMMVKPGGTSVSSDRERLFWNQLIFKQHFLNYLLAFDPCDRCISCERYS